MMSKMEKPKGTLMRITFDETLLVSSNFSTGSFIYKMPINNAFDKFFVDNVILDKRYEVNATNNEIKFTPVGTVRTATLNVGFYTKAKLLTEIKRVMDAAASGDSKTYTVIEEVNNSILTGKISITQNSGNFTIHESTSKFLLGLPLTGNTAIASTIIGTTTMRVDGPNVCYIISRSFGALDNFSGTKNNAVAFVPLSKPDAVSNYHPNFVDFTCLGSRVLLNQVEFELFDENKQPVVLIDKVPTISISFMTYDKQV